MSILKECLYNYHKSTISMENKYYLNDIIHYKEFCECGGLLVNNRGIYICYDCGTEHDVCVNKVPEWSENNESKLVIPRCNVYNNDLLYTSSIGIYSNNWMPSNERSLYLVFDKIKQMCDRGGLMHNIIELSYKLYSEVHKKQSESADFKQSRGDYRDGLIASCILYSCYEYNVPRSIQEISQICNVDKSDVTRGKKLFLELMKDTCIIDLSNATIKYNDYIERYCNVLNINNCMKTKLYELSNTVNEQKIIPKNTPQSMIYGCL